MRVHAVQLDSAWERARANFDRVEALLERAAPARGDLVVLPEMFDTGFSFKLGVTADRDGVTLAFLRRLASDLGVTVHGSRTVLGPDGRGRNRATIAGPTGEVLCEYEKIHPFSYGRETEFFSGGDSVAAYPWDDGRGNRTVVCPAVCYDLRFPELFRQGMLAGAEVFAIGANWPVARHAHWRALLIARAIENQALVIGVNRAGRDPHLEYGGGSIVVGARGDVLGELGSEEGVLSVAAGLGAIREWRSTFPAWRDARLLGVRGPVAGSGG